VLGVGAPVGLGLYLAWVDRERSAWTNLGGFAAAAGGALVGAFLGFNAAEDLLALLTTIAGAAAGGNLALLLLDIARGRRARDRAAVPAAEETLPATLPAD
jgi:uncharacterized membrane protein YebE (DUF533 family)